MVTPLSTSVFSPATLVHLQCWLIGCTRSKWCKPSSNSTSFALNVAWKLKPTRKVLNVTWTLDHWLTGDWVYLKLQPYIQTSLAPHSNQKLAIKFFGPFQIVARVGAVAYKLLLRLSPRSIQFSMYLSWSKLCQSNTRLLICLSPWMVFRCLNLFSNNALLLQTIRLFCRH